MYMNISDIACCVSCRKQLAEARTHEETFLLKNGCALMLPLCDLCLQFPNKCDMAAVLDDVFSYHLSDYSRKVVLQAITNNCINRYHNPKPVIIGLIFTHLHERGGTILLGRRAETMHQYPGALSLISGFMEVKHGGWRGSMRTEAIEEVAAYITEHSHSSMVPYTFESNPKGDLILNFAVVYPEALALGVFQPNKETSHRIEFFFTENNRPEFGIPIHQVVFDRWCQERFGWTPRQ